MSAICAWLPKRTLSAKRLLDTDHLNRCFEKKPPVHELKRFFWMKFGTTVMNPGMNLLRNTLVEVRQGKRNWKQWQLCRWDFVLIFDQILWDFEYLSVVTRSYLTQLWLFCLSNQVLMHCSFGIHCYWFSIFEVHLEPFEKNDWHIPAGKDDLVIVTTLLLSIFEFIKNGQKLINTFVCCFWMFNIILWC